MLWADGVSKSSLSDVPSVVLGVHHPPSLPRVVDRAGASVGIGDGSLAPPPGVIAPAGTVGGWSAGDTAATDARPWSGGQPALGTDVGRAPVVGAALDVPAPALHDEAIPQAAAAVDAPPPPPTVPWTQSTDHADTLVEQPPTAELATMPRPRVSAHGGRALGAGGRRRHSCLYAGLDCACQGGPLVPVDTTSVCWNDFDVGRLEAWVQKRRPLCTQQSGVEPA